MASDAIARTQSHSANFFNVPLSTEIQTPLQANSNREDVIIYNDSDRPLLVSFTGTVSESEYTFKILAGGYYETGLSTWMGAIKLLWLDSEGGGSGKALITELEV